MVFTVQKNGNTVHPPFYCMTQNQIFVCVDSLTPFRCTRAPLNIAGSFHLTQAKTNVHEKPICRRQNSELIRGVRKDPPHPNSGEDSPLKTPKKMDVLPFPSQRVYSEIMKE
ncbi:hypothetical protein TNCV_3962801 [Trichonephila clavipes]|nr:hypothetical protein TNCV_3962801 [Trichonephila clavipes]